MKEESNQALRNPVYYYFFNGVNLFVLVKFSAPGLMSWLLAMSDILVIMILTKFDVQFCLSSYSNDEWL